jgi:integrase
MRNTEALTDAGTFAPPKTKSAVRTVPIPAFAVERLKAHKAAQNARRLGLGADWHDLDLVCEHGDGSPISPGAFTHGLGRLAERAGLGEVRLHDLRHGVATALAKVRSVTARHVADARSRVCRVHASCVPARR